MDTAALGKMLSEGGFSRTLERLYGDLADIQPKRYAAALAEFEKCYGNDRQVRLFSAPGRTEIAGNHTDHQHGCVLASSVNLDMISVASKNELNTVRMRSQGYPELVVKLDCLEPLAHEIGTSAGLVRGVAAKMNALGYEIGGFDCYTTSTVLKGSGLSSSAAFEVLIGVMINGLYAGGKASAVEIAQIGQYAENVFFKKPCGLMDQMACSVGGLISIDFQNPAVPAVEQRRCALDEKGYALCITDTGGNHADLTAEYAAVPREMKQIAAHFGKEVLREVPPEEFFAALGDLRTAMPQRALLRAIHFFEENARVPVMAKALAEGDMDTFLRLEIESGISSFTQLQNVFPASFPQEQGLSLGLSVARRALGGQGSYRVHGGGFGGTMQAFLPKERLEDYVKQMESVFGKGSCYVLYLRPVGGTEVLPDK